MNELTKQRFDQFGTSFHWNIYGAEYYPHSDLHNALLRKGDYLWLRAGTKLDGHEANIESLVIVVRFEFEFDTDMAEATKQMQAIADASK